jgi:hypothetical protein
MLEDAEDFLDRMLRQQQQDESTQDELDLCMARLSIAPRCSKCGGIKLI